MIYNSFKYIFPPRPKNSMNPTELKFIENQGLIAQCKMNGSNGTLYISPDKIIVMNRHGQILTGFNIPIDEVKKLYRGNGGWMVLNFEYMNKSKKDENNETFNQKITIFDILVFDSNYMISSTFENRIKLLDDLYGKVECNKHYLYEISENVFRVKSYTEDFENKFNELIKIDMCEGLVFKRANGKLEMGLRPENTSKSQFKIRKPTKNYKF
jgi:hypothetical protein